MFIEFTLSREPIDPGTKSRRYYGEYELFDLKHRIYQWEARHNITCKQKTVKFTHRVIFPRDELYTFFALTFDQSEPHLRLRIVNR